MKQKVNILSILFFLSALCFGIAQEYQTKWPTIEAQQKPWTRWWWMGSAVDSINIKTSLISMSEVGLGGVEITPIYGVEGEEENDVPFLSKAWLNYLDYTIQIADSLDLQVDMNLGTGWPYGGPQIAISNAATKLVVDSLFVKKGERIQLNNIPDDVKERSTAKLSALLAYGSDGSYHDLTSKLSSNTLNWKAKKTNYHLVKVFTAKTGQQVKRAAPGGEGFTVDHYSNEALRQYLTPFDSAFANHGKGIRSIFNDSYEVYGTDFTPRFFEHFEQLRGYDLKPHFQQLLKKENRELNNRLRSDYRETLSDLLRSQFDIPWTSWANEKGFKTRLQAHGSPGNLIDLYAAADIPECETFGSMSYEIQGFRREKEDIREGDADPVMLKFSSSAAHIAGKPLVSSETFTWLRDHFKTSLSQCKPEAEDLLLNGVNHIFLHGATYSPKRAKWPGWKFYAAVNFNETNTIWEDAPALFSYLANCQSLLQAGRPDNDILLYWPVHDAWHKFNKGSLFFQYKIHSLDEWLHDTPFYKTATNLAKQGYSTDFISDRFVKQLKVENGQLVAPGGIYKSLIVPDVEHMPLATLNKLIHLKTEGGNIFFKGLPNTVPGFFQFEEQTKKLQHLLIENKSALTIDSSLEVALNAIGVRSEELVNTGLKYIRRNLNGDKVYFLVNHTSKKIDTLVPLNVSARKVEIFDPLNKDRGQAKSIRKSGKTFVKVQIPSGGSLFLKTTKDSSSTAWKYFEAQDKSYELKGDWQLHFLKGGPSLPENRTVSSLTSWTNYAVETASFSGTVSYEITFQNPDAKQNYWRLNLGDVRESAKVWLNNKYIGTAWSNPFELTLTSLENGKNKLRIEVTNLPANRIRAKEMRGEAWKIFREINMVNKDYQTFDATLWQPMPSGLLNEISITPMTLLSDD